MVLSVGDIILIEDGMNVSVTVPETLVYSNRKGHWSMTKTVVTVNGRFDWIAGHYIVDVVTDNEIRCVSVENTSFEIEFSRDRSYSNYLPKTIRVLGKAKKIWELPPKAEG